MTRLNLGSSERIPVGEGREFASAAGVFAVFRARAGGLYATQASCPHKGGPLCEGVLGGTTVACPLHGFSFDVATGQPVGSANTCPPLQTYPVSLDERGHVIIEVTDTP
jgi:nitrite reductase (NADH) small subunit